MDLKRYGSLGKNSYGIQVLFKEGWDMCITFFLTSSFDDIFGIN